MTILLEAYNVVIKIDSLIREFGENYESFYSLIPNQTDYQDSKLLRVGFMYEKDVDNFIDVLIRNGLNILDEKEYYDDFAVIAQGFDLACNCEWLHLFKINFSEKELDVAAYKDPAGIIYFEEDENCFICGEDWSVEGYVQLLQKGKYLKTIIKEDEDGAIDVYIDQNNNCQYLGRSKRWFDLPLICLLRMPLRLSLIMAIAGVIVLQLIGSQKDIQSSKIVWGLFMGGSVGLSISFIFAKRFPMTPSWIRRLIGE